MRSRVIDIVEKHYRQYQMVIKAKDNKDLEEFVIASTPQLSDPKYSFMQRVEWVVSGRTAFPVCQNESCCKVLDDPKYFHSIRKGYSHHCCMSCSTSD